MVPRSHDHSGAAKLVAERFDRLVALMGVMQDVVLDRHHCEGDALFFNQGYIIAGHNTWPFLPKCVVEP